MAEPPSKDRPLVSTTQDGGSKRPLPDLEDVCCLCSRPWRDEAVGLSMWSSCGHDCYHWACLRRLLLGEKTKATCWMCCHICGASVWDSFDWQELRIVHEEASPRFREADARRIELWLSAELSLSRPVTLHRHVPASIFKMEGLRCLDFTGHPIAEIPPAIGALRSLQRLVLVALHLRQLPEQIGELVSLEQLIVSSCPLEEVPVKVGKLPKLWDFYLDGNLLRKMPITVSQSIDTIKVSSNLLEELSFDPVACSRVSEIRAYANRLASLPDTLCQLKGLRGLVVHANRLSKLPDQLSLATQLVWVMLADNRLESLPDGIADLQLLEWLYLYNNRLQKLPHRLLHRGASLKRILVEANPLDGPSLHDLLDEVPNHVHVLGIDMQQVSTLQQHRASSGSTAALCSGSTSSIISGWIMPWGSSDGLYAKLLPASQLAWFKNTEKQSGGDSSSSKNNSNNECSGSNHSKNDSNNNHHDPKDSGNNSSNNNQNHNHKLNGLNNNCNSNSKQTWRQRVVDLGRTEPTPCGDVLVVAFSASQGEPEWLGTLGKLLEEGQDVTKAGSRAEAGSFRATMKAVVEGLQENVAAEQDRPAGALWQEFCTTPPLQEKPLVLADTAGRFLQARDFDILCLCDTSAEWYCSKHGQPRDLEEKLQAVFSKYKRVLYLGVSMGGFGALLHSHLADTVCVFSPQTDLSRSHLRPGWHPDGYALASRRLRENVAKALARGVRFEYHTAANDHLLHARWLPLPESSFIIHPILGRVARLMERTDTLVPLLTSLVIELQDPLCIRPWPASVQFAAQDSDRDVAWDWSDDATESLLVAKWRATGGITLLRASPADVASIAKYPPAAGDWFCPRCCFRNFEAATSCASCSKGWSPYRKVSFPTYTDLSQLLRPHWCYCCREGSLKVAEACPKCSGPWEMRCAFCRKGGLEGRADQLGNLWFCNACWEQFAKHAEIMKQDFPAGWFLEGDAGQLWTFFPPKGERRVMEFARNGGLLTSCGRGWWEVDPNRCMKVYFADPHEETWRLERVSTGFKAYRVLDEAEVLDEDLSRKTAYGEPYISTWASGASEGGRMPCFRQ